MDRDMTPAEALTQALEASFERRGVDGDAAEWAEDLTQGLAAVGFKVSWDYHQARDDDHAGNCYHSGRPENLEPFVLSGTPLELRSSEGDAGRYRHWGGDDLWVCRAHLTYDAGEVSKGPAWDRTMEFHEAIEHLAARDGVHEAVEMTLVDVSNQEKAYLAVNADRLATLDAAAPNGGHQARTARRSQVGE